MQIHIDPQAAVPYAVILVMLVTVLSRAVSSKKAAVAGLWISPACLVVAALALLALSRGALEPLPLLGLVLAFLIGGAIGWRRGRLTPVEIEPRTGVLASPLSPGGVMAVTGLFLVRYFVHTLAVYEPKALLGGGPQTLALIADGLVLFAVGLVAARGLEVCVRGRRLLRETAGTTASN